MEDDYRKWFTQFRKGYLELCVLLALRERKNMHGVLLIDFFEQNELFINEGTLYPLLNRMEQNGLLVSTWNIPEQKGHPKKEYKLSTKGKKLLPKMLENYNAHHKSLKKIKGEIDG